MNDDKLFQWLSSVKGDPLAFVMGAFPWNEPGTVLENSAGPEQWACDLMNRIRNDLVDINTAIQEAIASGHGIAKSATVAQLTLWAFCTLPDTRGVITANTETQLKTKTWAELGKWFNLCFFAREHFTLTATGLFSKDPNRERTWRIDMIPWSEKNPAAFAGLHNKGKRLLLIFDEASEIPDIIWETAEGALTDADTEIIWLAFGNPTRNIGRFKECFPGGKFANQWHHLQIDSRTVRITNKKRLQGWIDAYGLDSDFVRVRVLGEFPRKGLMEFFSATAIDEAMSRDVYVDRAEPLALGVDVARFGMNASVIFPRKGRDARTIERFRYNGYSTTQLASEVTNIQAQYHADGIMIDGGGVGGGVVDQVRAKRLFCYEVQFGGKDVIHNTIGVTFYQSGGFEVGAASGTDRGIGTITAVKALMTAAAAPTASSCGTGPAVDSGSSSNAGKFTIGTGATACTLTFANAFTTNAYCTVTPLAQPAAVANIPYISAQSRTAFTVSGGTASTAYQYTCGGN